MIGQPSSGIRILLLRSVGERWQNSLLASLRKLWAVIISLMALIPQCKKFNKINSLPQVHFLLSFSSSPISNGKARLEHHHRHHHQFSNTSHLHTYTQEATGGCEKIQNARKVEFTRSNRDYYQVIVFLIVYCSLYPFYLKEKQIVGNVASFGAACAF